MEMEMEHNGAEERGRGSKKCEEIPNPPVRYNFVAQRTTHAQPNNQQQQKLKAISQELRGTHDA